MKVMVLIAALLLALVLPRMETFRKSIQSSHNDNIKTWQSMMPRI